MISKRNKEKMLVAMTTTAKNQSRDNPYYWDDDAIQIITNAIMLGEELRGNDRRNIGTAFDEKGKVADVIILKGYHDDVKLGVQIPKKTMYSKTDFNFQAFQI